MIFSERTSWYRVENRLSQLYHELRAKGTVVHDLTISNPTMCGIRYPDKKIISALSDPKFLGYSPDPRGLKAARLAVADYYREHQAQTDEANIFLTASTSEAYSMLFTLLCNPGETVLAPRPSYPLFEFLARFSGVNLKYYSLRYDGGWYIDIESLARSVGPSTKAIVLVHPHNPTGMFIKNVEHKQILAIAERHRLALIADEVFLDFPIGNPMDLLGTTAGTSDILTFTLSGISKTLGLPQLKLGWITISGNEKYVKESAERLEILSDTFLSVNTPVQLALSDLLKCGKEIRESFKNRIESNYLYIRTLFSGDGGIKKNPCSLLETEGGWYAVIRVPRTRSAESWSVELLLRYHVYIYPGHFFDFEDEGYLIASLLTEEATFRQSVGKLAEYIAESVR